MHDWNRYSFDPPLTHQRLVLLKKNTNINKEKLPLWIRSFIQRAVGMLIVKLGNDPIHRIAQRVHIVGEFIISTVIMFHIRHQG